MLHACKVHYSVTVHKRMSSQGLSRPSATVHRFWSRSTTQRRSSLLIVVDNAIQSAYQQPRLRVSPRLRPVEKRLSSSVM